MTIKTRTASVLLLSAAAITVLAGCTSAPSAADSARAVAEDWVSAFSASDAEKSESLACDGMVLGNSNPDGFTVSSHEVTEVVDNGDGTFDVTVSLKTPDAPNPEWSPVVVVDVAEEACIVSISG